MLLNVLKGHTTQETAYIVSDYPYGFKLRCKIRYWLEFKKGHGFRLMSATTNPKLSSEIWNKPKASTYCMLAVMGLDGQDHVTWDGCNIYEFDKLEAFEAKYGADFDETQRGVFTAALAAYKAYKARQTKPKE